MSRFIFEFCRHALEKSSSIGRYFGVYANIIDEIRALLPYFESLTGCPENSNVL